MAFEDWLYRKADQNAHNEILAFLMMIVGVNLLIGGLVITVVTVREPILLPSMAQQPLSFSATLGLVLTVAGFAVVSVGFILVIHYDKEMTWYMRETEKATAYKKKKTASRTANKAIEEWLGRAEKDAN